MKRIRSRSHRGGGGVGGGGPPRQYNGNIPLNRNHVFDSNGPDLRIRGTAQQLFEKYLQLGRDAAGSGDRVMAEGYFQHAEHYFRIVGAINQQQGQGQYNNNATAGGNAPQAPYAQQGSRYRGGAPQQDYNADPNQGDDRDDGYGEGPEGRDIPIAAEPPIER